MTTEAKPIRHDGYAVGDSIRAYDHEPCDGRPLLYVEGRIVARLSPADMYARGMTPYDAWLVAVEIDTTFPERAREQVFVPLQLLMTEYPGRVQKVERDGWIDPGRLVGFGRDVLRLLAGEASWSPDTLDRIAALAHDAEIASTRSDGRFQIPLRRSPPIRCSHCGGEFLAHEQLADAGAWLHCPDCCSSCDLEPMEAPRELAVAQDLERREAGAEIVEEIAPSRTLAEIIAGAAPLHVPRARLADYMRAVIARGIAGKTWKD